MVKPDPWNSREFKNNKKSKKFGNFLGKVFVSGIPVGIPTGILEEFHCCRSASQNILTEEVEK